MYEEKPKKQINYKSLILKLLLLALIFFAIFWLFTPRKDKKENNDDKTFNKNITNMKSAAKKYFNDQTILPSKTGERVRITLQEMLNKKLIVKFTDKNGHYCDVDNSYSQVTKTGDNEYQLKVLLSCEDQTDYIVESLNSVTKEEKEDKEEKTTSKENENKTDNNNQNSNKKSTDVNNNVNDSKQENENNTQTYKRTEYYTQYEFRKAETNTNTTYSCPAGYSLNGTSCAKSIVSSKINATEIYGEDKELITDALINDSGNYTVYADPIEVKDFESYSCPNGYTKIGSGNNVKCQKMEQTPAITINTYSCPSGTDIKTGSNASLKCYDKDYKNKIIDYTCPNGYFKEGSGENLKCYKKLNCQKTEYKTVCQEGDLVNGVCKVYVGKAKTTSTWNYSYTTTSNKPLYSTSSIKYEAVGGRTTKYVCTKNNCPGIVSEYKYKVYKLKTNTKCTTGTNINGKCYSYKNPIKKKVTSNYTCKKYEAKNIEYNCPVGYAQKEGSGKNLKCYKKTLLKTIVNTSYKCSNSNSTLKDKSCYNQVEIDPDINIKYTCPDGYKATGSGKDTICSKIVTGNKTYYCADAEATLKGDKCYKKTKGDVIGYTCPDGYSRDGKYCYKTENKIIDAIKNEDNNTTYKYTWSNNKTLDGWEFTGNTRQVSKDVYDNVETPNTDILNGKMSIMDIILFSFVIIGFTYLIFMTIKSYKGV